jgi:hypothetical protein
MGLPFWWIPNYAPILWYVYKSLVYLVCKGYVKLYNYDLPCFLVSSNTCFWWHHSHVQILPLHNHSLQPHYTCFHNWHHFGVCNLTTFCVICQLGWLLMFGMMGLHLKFVQNITRLYNQMGFYANNFNFFGVIVCCVWTIYLAL